MILIAVLALQVSAQLQISNFKFNHVAANGRWVFSWDTPDEGRFAHFQFKGGGITNTWVTISFPNLSVRSSGGKTYASITALNTAANATTHFRMKWSNGQPLSQNNYAWAYTSLSSAPS